MNLSAHCPQTACPHNVASTADEAFVSDLLHAGHVHVLPLSALLIVADVSREFLSLLFASLVNFMVIKDFKDIE